GPPPPSRRSPSASDPSRAPFCFRYRRRQSRRLRSLRAPSSLRALSSPNCLRPRLPASGEALGKRNREVEADAEDAGDCDLRPRFLELEERRVLLDVRTERVERPAVVLADDRADHREDACHAKRGEDERQRGRKADES